MSRKARPGSRYLEYDRACILWQMLSGAVLSGGMSTRMGREKGLVVLGGRPLVAHVAAVLDEVADEVVVAVARGMGEAYRTALGPGMLIAEDELEGAGPIQGLITALGAARGEYVLVSPCDTPFLRADVCRAMAAKAKGRDGAVPVVAGKFEPLHGVYRRGRALEAFIATAAEGKRKPIQAYDRLDIDRVDAPALRALDPELESFWNLNTPEDLASAERRLGAR